MGKSFFYRDATFYIWGLKWIHKGALSKRYSYMASLTRREDCVLEAACGPAILAEFLPKGVHYSGFDTNKNFINYALKRNLDVHLGNILNPTSFRPTDIVVICDILHHLKPKERKTAIKHCFDSAKRRLIICEPIGKTHTRKPILYPLHKWWFEYIEQDGTNKPQFDNLWTRTEFEAQIKRGFGIIPPATARTIKEIGKDLIIVYEK